MHDIAFCDNSLVAVESGEDAFVRNVDPPLADVGRGDRVAGHDGLLPEEIAERDDSDVRHCSQGIEQGTATATATADQPDSQDVGPGGMNPL